MNVPFHLDSYLEIISEKVGRAGTVTVNRESETARLRSIPQAELAAAGTSHRLRIVRRLNGQLFTFTRKAPA